ncbi:MAG: hypothetical protein OHK0046_11480 [Anaerolineae bacterium]
MRKFTSPPGLELAGYMTMTFVNNLQSVETTPVLARHGLANLDPNGWYPASKFMDALNELTHHDNRSANFVAIGLEVGKATPFPPDVRTLEDALLGWDKAYKSVHRNHHNDIGSVKLQKVSPSHFKTIHDHLYPDDFSYGIIYGFAQRFLPQSVFFKVYYDLDLPRRDIDNADQTVIHIEWD